MRALVAFLAMAFAVWSVPLALAGEDGDCARGPYEMRLPANVDCCGWTSGPFCLFDCTVWANNPVDVGPDVCVRISSMQ